MPLNVPHFPISATPVHLTYRLAGSIPRSVEMRIQAMERSSLAEARKRLEGLTGSNYGEAWRLEMERIDRQTEAATDEALHRADFGPMHLSDPAIRTIVLDSWQFLHSKGVISLYAVCVMSNHVHVILAAGKGDIVDIGLLVNRHKSYTAGCSNSLLDTTGQPFWAKNYFDRTIRLGRWMSAMWYVLLNPVKAGLTENWEDWPGTFVNPEYACHFPLSRLTA